MALASDSLSSAYELSDIFHYRAKDVFRRAPNPVRLPSLFRGHATSPRASIPSLMTCSGMAG